MKWIGNERGRAMKSKHKVKIQVNNEYIKYLEKERQELLEQIISEREELMAELKRVKFQVKFCVATVVQLKKQLHDLEQLADEAPNEKEES